MADSSDVVTEARTWIGTKFHHQGRLKGVGVDCAGIITQTAFALGVSDFDTTDYARIPDGVTLRALCDEHMDLVAEGPGAADAALPGHVLLMRFGEDGDPHHLAIRTPAGIVHAYARRHRVVETGYDPTWRDRTIAVYQYRGLS